MDPQTPPATPPADPPSDPASLLTPPADPAAPPAPASNDWLPAKFHVTKEDGTFDEAASARKLAESYTALEAHKGPVLKAPETPEGYTIAAPVDADGKPIEGIDIEAFTKDPLFQALAKDAHAKGIPNEHLQWAVHQYLQLAPDLVAADKALSVEEASAELSKAWGGKASFDANLATARDYVAGFAKGVAADQPGNFDKLNAKFGTDPDFIAFMAKVGDECKAAGLKFGEDTPAHGAASTSDADIDALMKGEAYWNPAHAEHEKVKSKVASHFQRKFGTEPHR